MSERERQREREIHIWINSVCFEVFGCGVARVDSRFAQALVTHTVRTHWGACCPEHLEVN